MKLEIATNNGQSGRFSSVYMSATNYEGLADGVINRVLGMLQSNENIHLEDLDISAQTVKLHRGGHRLNPMYIEDLSKKKSVVTISNKNDHMCALRALCVQQ